MAWGCRESAGEVVEAFLADQDFIVRADEAEMLGVDDLRDALRIWCRIERKPVPSIRAMADAMRRRSPAKQRAWISGYPGWRLGPVARAALRRRGILSEPPPTRFAWQERRYTSKRQRLAKRQPA